MTYILAFLFFFTDSVNSVSIQTILFTFTKLIMILCHNFGFFAIAKKVMSDHKNYNLYETYF